VADVGVYSGAWLPRGVGVLTVTIDAHFEGQDYTLGVTGTVYPLLELTLGMVADDGARVVVVLDAIADSALASIDIPSANAMGDCAITRDQTLGFVTNFENEVWVIDLLALTLAGGTNPIAISNLGEDLSFSPDEKYLLACDGAATQPVSVIDIATRNEVSTFPMSRGCNSIDVCSDGSVLVTSFDDRNVRRLMIDGDGNLTDTGDVLVLSEPANNVVCDPHGSSGVVITRSGNLRSFVIPGLTPVDLRDQAGTSGISGQIDPSGTRLYARSNGGVVELLDYDSSSAEIGAAPVWKRSIQTALTYFGMDQIALHPGAPKLYVSQTDGVRVLDSDNGALLATITHPDFIQPTGICFGNVAASPPPQPEEICGEIEEEDFGAYEAYACTVKQGAGTVKVFNQQELDAYMVDFGFDGDKVRNLNVAFNPTGDVEIRSPCHVSLSGLNNYLDITASSVRVFGRSGVAVAEDYANVDRGITSEGKLTLVSTQGQARFHKGIELSASRICVQADGRARIGEANVVQAELVELISTGDRTDSHAQIGMGSQVIADLLRLEASREVSIGEQTTIDVGELILHSTGAFTLSVAYIKQGASVIADSISMISGNKATVQRNTNVQVVGEFEMDAQTEAKCTVHASALIVYGARTGNCSAVFPAPDEQANPGPAPVPSATLSVRIVMALLLLVMGSHMIRVRTGRD
jgi:WD40 repeat protein